MKPLRGLLKTTSGICFDFVFSFSRFFKTAKRKQTFTDGAVQTPTLPVVSEANTGPGIPAALKPTPNVCTAMEKQNTREVEYGNDSGRDEAGERGRAGPHGRAARDGEGMTSAEPGLARLSGL